MSISLKKLSFLFSTLMLTFVQFLMLSMLSVLLIMLNKLFLLSLLSLLLSFLILLCLLQDLILLSDQHALHSDILNLLFKYLKRAFDALKRAFDNLLKALMTQCSEILSDRALLFFSKEKNLDQRLQKSAFFCRDSCCPALLLSK